MKVNIPFYENNGDGNQCMQVAMQSVLKYFLNKEFSLEQLDHLTKRKKGLWTYTVQIVPVLYDLGLRVKYYTTVDIKGYLQGKAFIHEQYGKNAEKILHFTDIHALQEAAQRLLQTHLFEKTALSIHDLENHLRQGHIPLVLIDYTTLTNNDGLFQGHFVVVTGFDKNHVYYHESGPVAPQPHKKVKKERFEKAMEAQGTDHDCVLVFGRR